MPLNININFSAVAPASVGDMVIVRIPGQFGARDIKARAWVEALTVEVSSPTKRSWAEGKVTGYRVRLDDDPKSTHSVHPRQIVAAGAAAREFKQEAK